VVLYSNDVDAARDHFARSVGAAVQDCDDPNGNVGLTRGFQQCVEAVREFDGFIVGGDYYKNLVDGHGDDPFLTLASRRFSASRSFKETIWPQMSRAFSRSTCETKDVSVKHVSIMFDEAQ
jgi:hypothetical protein